ncbi:protein spinster homolog 3 [Sminthopsis crassicaudata]|uniref:protein spinster homolog 3 n=1 Tax=Sminthopsis crassicaudata TaxID=9301 RepID=UPI003D691AB0
MEKAGWEEASPLRAQPGPPLYGTAGAPAGARPEGPPGVPRSRAYGAVAVLCYINLLNYMNWSIIPGVLLDIQKHFHIRDSEAGLLQTVFILGLLLAAPPFGYLGDRYSRKAILSVGIVLWSSCSLGGSFLPGRHAWLFFLARGGVGAGVAGYSTVAPTIIADLFVPERRTWMLSLFYVFIPVGSGLGYVLGSAVTKATGEWPWAFRVTPCLEAAALLLLLLLVPDPPRGAAEQGSPAGRRTGWWEDVRCLGRNRSFVWSTLGVTAMAYVIGALAFWVPSFLTQIRVLHGLQPPCLREPCDSSDSLIFGALTVGTGIVGVLLGAEIARRLKKLTATAEPLVCAGSLLAAAPCLYLSIVLAQRSLLAAYVFLALGELLLSFNWALVTDILLAVVVPTRRGTAAALQISVSHILGDAGSPYITGLVAGALQAAHPDSFLWLFRSLQYSFFTCAFVGALGGGCFLVTALHVERPRPRAPDTREAWEPRG